MRPATTIATALLLLTAACASGAQSQTATSDAPEPVAEQAGAASTASTEASEAEMPAVPVALTRSNHNTAMTEVVLDPTARAALTIDDDGGVRLWTDLNSKVVESPLALPVFEPVWMSLAKDGEDFVAAFIDTAGGARAGRITIDDSGAQWTSLFEMPATAPFFEIHVLDGGERMVALGVDHRVHLWDADGRDISVLDVAGFVPWQLRVHQPEGAAPSLLAVLAGPSRVQRLQLHDDALSVVGDAHEVSLDRGPNRGDLTMSPDGKTVFALRRPKRRSKRFELEAISMDSGERTVFAAESDKRRRPRVHALDGGRVLLETGSGKAAYVDTSQATPWPPADGSDADRETIENSPLAMFDMKHSTRRSRVHSTVVDGVRAVPLGSTLVVDPLDSDTHTVIERNAVRTTAVALDDDGGRAVWRIDEGLLVDDLDNRGPAERILEASDVSEVLAFVGDDRLVELRANGRARIVDLNSGAEVDTAKIKVQWDIRNAGWRPNDTGGQLVVGFSRPKAALAVLGAGAGGFEPVTEVATHNRGEWPESGSPRNRANRLWLEEIGVAHEDLRLRNATVVTTMPSPNAERMAIVQDLGAREIFDVELEEWVELPNGFVVTMIDTEAHRRLWTRALPRVWDVAWSGNGERLGVATETGGFVYAATDGKQVHARRDRGVSTAVVPDQDSPSR